MNLSKNFTLQELTKSDTAVRKGIDNNPNSDQIAKLQLLFGTLLIFIIYLILITQNKERHTIKVCLSFILIFYKSYTSFNKI